MNKDLREYIDYSKKLKIMFIEDNEDVKEQLLKLLANLFTHIDVEENGKNAYKMYLDFHKNTGEFYDLIITDLNIPGINGFELLSKVKEQNPEQLALVISAHTEPSKLSKLEKIGIFKFIQKPIEYSSFMDTYIEIIKKIKENKKD